MSNPNNRLFFFSFFFSLFIKHEYRFNGSQELQMVKHSVIYIKHSFTVNLLYNTQYIKLLLL